MKEDRDGETVSGKDKVYIIGAYRLQLADRCTTEPAPTYPAPRACELEGFHQQVNLSAFHTSF